MIKVVVSRHILKIVLSPTGAINFVDTNQHYDLHLLFVSTTGVKSGTVILLSGNIIVNEFVTGKIIVDEFLTGKIVVKGSVVENTEVKGSVIGNIEVYKFDTGYIVLSGFGSLYLLRL